MNPDDVITWYAETPYAIIQYWTDEMWKNGQTYICACDNEREYDRSIISIIKRKMHVDVLYLRPSIINEKGPKF